MRGRVSVLLAMVVGAMAFVSRRRASRRPTGRSGAHATRASRTNPASSAAKDPPAAKATGDGLPRTPLAECGKSPELFEKAGDFRRAAELYEARSLKLRESAEEAAGRESALKSGRLFERIGDADRALAVLLGARCLLEAAAVHESRGDLSDAAECFLQAGEPETAAEYFARAGEAARGHKVLSRFRYGQGRVREAAEQAEWAGDTVEAARMFREAGDHARAEDLCRKSGELPVASRGTPA